MSGQTLCLINGLPGKQVSIADRGLRYGDGVFRTALILNAQIIDIERHIRHLSEGCERLGLVPPDAGTIHNEMTICAKGQPRATLRYTITAGPGPRGYRRTGDQTPTRICESSPLDATDDATAGVQVRWCTMRVGCNPALAGIKTLNRLEQVIARGEWSDPDVREGLLIDSEGHVTGGTMSNLFVVRAGALQTPLLERSGVRGVQREVILEMASSLGIPTKTVNLSASEVDEADELFLTNSIIGLWPVIRVGDRRKAIGPLTERFRHELHKKHQEYL